VAEAVARRIDRYFRTVEQRAAQPELIAEVERVLGDPQVDRLLQELNRRDLASQQRRERVEQFTGHPARSELQRMLERWVAHPGDLPVASWFVVGPRGVHLAAAFPEGNAESPVGGDFDWRSYFHGGPEDRPRTAPEGPPIRTMHLSSVFRSTATNHSKVAISSPLWNHQGELIGVMALTIDLGRVVEFPEESERLFTVLVDGRPGQQQGMILEHPLYTELLRRERRVPDRLLSDYRVRIDQWPGSGMDNYRDPLGKDQEGGEYRGRWIAAKQPVRMQSVTEPSNGDADTGLMVIVQEDYASVTAPVRTLGQWLVGQGILAMFCFTGVVILLWYAVRREREERLPPPLTPPSRSFDDTLSLPHPDAAGSVHG
jgi:hypothetical protein